MLYTRECSSNYYRVPLLQSNLLRNSMIASLLPTLKAFLVIEKFIFLRARLTMIGRKLLILRRPMNSNLKSQKQKFLTEIYIRSQYRSKNNTKSWNSVYCIRYYVRLFNSSNFHYMLCISLFVCKRVKQVIMPRQEM